MSPTNPSPQGSLNASDGKQLATTTIINSVGAACASVVAWFAEAFGKVEVPAQVVGAFTVMFTGAFLFAYFLLRGKPRLRKKPRPAIDCDKPPETAPQQQDENE